MNNYYVFDFDGVFTDNRVFVNESGIESVICSRYDGFGIKNLHENSIHSYVLTSEAKEIANVVKEIFDIDYDVSELDDNSLPHDIPGEWFKGPF